MRLSSSHYDSNSEGKSPRCAVALLLGSPDPLIRPGHAPRLAPICSLAYFRRVIEELQENPAQENHREYPHSSSYDSSQRHSRQKLRKLRFQMTVNSWAPDPFFRTIHCRDFADFSDQNDLVTDREIQIGCRVKPLRSVDATPKLIEVLNV